MPEKYPFILPILIVWFVGFFIPIIIVFYTSFGLKNKPVLNRKFTMRCVSITLFLVAIMILISGILQLFGKSGIYFGKPSEYWHALVGFLFILAALNHIAIHIKDIYRYIFERKPKQPTTEIK